MMVIIPRELHDLIDNAKNKFRLENGEMTDGDSEMIVQSLLHHYDQTGEVPNIEDLSFKKNLPKEQTELASAHPQQSLPESQS